MANLFTNAIDVTPGSTGVWVDIDVSAYIPADATGVIIQVVNTSASSRAWGIRKPGSTDARTTQAASLRQNWGYIGVNNQVFQGYVAGAGLLFKLLGYFTSDGVFFTNGYNKEPATLSSWVNVDCSAEIPTGAKFAVLELSNTNSSHGLRPVGSTDNRYSYVTSHGFALVGLDSNRVFQYRKTNDDATLYLVGYLTAGTPKINGVDVSLTSTEAYVNIDRSGDADSEGATGVLVEAIATSSYRSYALRKNGSTDDFYNSEYHAWGVVGLDASRIFQGKISVTDFDFYIMGYLAAPPPSAYEYTGRLRVAPKLKSQYHKEPYEYTGILRIAPKLKFQYRAERNYTGYLRAAPKLKSQYHAERSYVGRLRVAPELKSSYFFGYEYKGQLRIAPKLAGDYFAVLGRLPIPGPYLLRYPNPRNGQTNVPIGNPIKFIIKSDGAGVDIDTVKVKIVDSQGTNVYDKTSPYFRYSGKKSRYEVEVRPPQPWAYEENVQAEIEAEDLAGTPGPVYE